MATSGSTDYAVNRDNSIKRALRIVGAAASGETPSADEMSEASDALNRLLKSWQSEGLFQWQRTTVSFQAVASQTSYKIGPSGDVDTTRPLNVQYAYRRNNSNVDTELLRISVQEYWQLPNKSTTGTPTQYAFDPQLGNSVFYVWPAESAANTTNFYLQCDMPFDDMDAAANNFDFPVEAQNAIDWGLAAELAPEYGQDLNFISYVTQKAEMEKQKWISGDQEAASVYFRPARRR